MGGAASTRGGETGAHGGRMQMGGDRPGPVPPYFMGTSGAYSKTCSKEVTIKATFRKKNTMRFPSSHSRGWSAGPKEDPSTLWISESSWRTWNAMLLQMSSWEGSGQAEGEGEGKRGREGASSSQSPSLPSEFWALHSLWDGGARALTGLCPSPLVTTRGMRVAGGTT
ncbi:hypothetical protein AX15_007496 [Amanita polypyramis BW_CC]|nr:hypothetical protein AX15_007496 [Amanita polypyramis BW_CC]